MKFDVGEEEFQEVIRNCSMVYMPINVETQGSQIVIFQAGLYKKPVVTTRTKAISTYI